MKDIVKKIDGIDFVEFIPEPTQPKNTQPLVVRVSSSTYFGIEGKGFVGSFIVRDHVSRKDHRLFSSRVSEYNVKDLPISIVIRSNSKGVIYRSVVVLKDYRIVDEKTVGVVLGGSLKSSDNRDSVKFVEAVSKLSSRIRKVFDRIGFKSFKDIVEFPESRFASVVGVGVKQVREFAEFRESVCKRECGAEK